MELNRENIIKALECCANGGWCIRDGCPFYKDDEFGDIEKCTSELTKNALSLIKELTEDIEWSAKRILESDKRVAELTEENASLNASCTELERKCASLNDENERLIAAIPLWAKQCVELEERCMKLRADTVSEMQERLKHAPIKIGLPLFGLQTKDEIVDYANELLLQIGDAIDQIAEEILEGKDENND